MVTLIYPATGIEVTADASNVEGLLAAGFIQTGEPAADPSPEAEVVEADTDEDVEDTAPSEPAAPALSASRKVWAEYAQSLGLETEGLKRDEIRDLVAEKEA